MLRFYKTSLAFVLLSCATFADTLQFNNGDTLSGTLVSNEGGTIVFKSDIIGEIAVPADQATVVGASISEAAEDVVSAAAADGGETVDPSLGDSGEEENNAFDKGVMKAKSYVDYIVPEGWSGKVNLGVSYVDTNTSSQAWTAKIAAKKDAGKNHYGVGAFYNFTSQTDSAGIEEKTLDKWGGYFSYSRDISERWFLQSDTDYLRDLVKNINHQATETLSLGYKVVNEEDFTFNILPGIAGQYIEAEGFNENWIFYATFSEELMYKFNETFRVEQDAGIRVNPTDTSEYQLYANAAFIAKLTEWIDASLNYQYSYDTTVGPGSNRGEQQIIFALGVPF